MATLVAIRQGIRDRLLTIPGLRAYDVMPPNPQVPAAAVLPSGWDYDQTFDGNVVWRFEVWVYVQPTPLDRAQLAIDAYLAPSGAQSIATAINGDQTLGVAGVDYAIVQGARDYARLVDAPGGSQLLAGSLQVVVRAAA